MKEAGEILVHISGPDYCPQEMGSASEIACLLEDSGYRTYLPSRDGIGGHLSEAAVEPRGDSGKLQGLLEASFALEIFQVVERCDCLVFNMNGRVPDEGGLFETAVAFTAGKPIVIYKRDHRSVFNGSDNSMITGLIPTFSTVGELRRIPIELSRAIGDIETGGGYRYRGDTVPPPVGEAVCLGRQVWELMHQESYREAAANQRISVLVEFIERKMKPPGR